MDRREDRREDAATPQLAPEAVAAAAPPATPAEPDLAAQLEQLSKLKEQGLISEAEFEAKKKQILGI